MVHIANLNGNAACRSLPDNIAPVFAPAKMLMPLLLARMKKGGGLAGKWVNRCGTGRFEFIARVASKTKILKSGDAADRFRDDMVYDKACTSECDG